MISLIVANLELQEARNGKQIAEKKKEEAIRAEPSSSVKPAAPKQAIGGVSEFTLEGLPR
jgi:hypothetical protein